MRHGAMWLLCALLLTGCTSAISLRHQDGRKVECGPFWADGALGRQAAWREAKCVDDYQRQGFVRVP